MLVIVSPAKRLDWTEVANAVQTRPEFGADAVYLAGVAAKLSKPQLRKLMDISEDLARLNQARFRVFVPDPSFEATRPAAYAFAGDTYQGLGVRGLDAGDLDHAQGHLRILSGLYGLLRPLDAIQPYRLEMGSRLKTRAGATLYTYWGARLAEALNRQARETGSTALINCASQEYFAAVPADAIDLPIITPVFLEERDGDAKIISFFAKKARGAMARYVIANRLTAPDDLRGFDLDGYRYDAARSTPERPTFLRALARDTAA